jgi:L-fucose mutarotase/ribose pyranase (RbsD/FucU family)
MLSAFQCLIAAVLLSSLAACQAQQPSSDQSHPLYAADANGSANWRQILADRLPLYGHRNWIVIADSAYPAQTRPGIETIVTNADQIEVTKAVLDLLDHARHVTPTVFTDAELQYVPEKDAPGIEAYRKQLSQLLGSRKVEVIPHEQVIARLDKAGETFKVLILKTNLTIPYTSVFLQLDCAYWPAEAESRLRDAMRKPDSR